MSGVNTRMRYCAGCMTELTESGQCPNPTCRWDEGSESILHENLPRHYLLSGRYYIGRVLGQGGFGVTYLARDTELERLVAIKEYLPRETCSRLTDRITVHSHGGEKEERFYHGMQGFLNEAKNIARLDGHPNIVSITDHLKANGTAYMVMQFISGITLKQYLSDKGGRIPHTTAREIMLHVMAALRRAHQHNVLHRDISPDNIMLSNEGQVKIIDFGAARQASSETGVKSAGLTVILKPGYAPEEQYRSKGRQGPWTDVYAVTATLYRCITGEVPPAAPDRPDEELVPATRLCSDLPKGLDAVLQKGMALKMEDRYQSIDELQKALLDAGVAEERKEIRGEEKKAGEVRHGSEKIDMSARETPVQIKRGEPTKQTQSPWYRSPIPYIAAAVLMLAVAAVLYYSGAFRQAGKTAVQNPVVNQPQPAPPVGGTPHTPGGSSTSQSSANSGTGSSSGENSQLPSGGNSHGRPASQKRTASRESDEEVGGYTWCSESPDPTRCRAYKNREGLKDGPTH